jgi:hypothetical protein
MGQKLRIKFLFRISVFLSWKSISNFNILRQKTIKLERLHNFNQILTKDTILDTYYHRIQGFLNERNTSILSYQRMNTTNDDLEREINMKVTHLRLSQHPELFNIKNDQELQHGCQQSCCWSRRKLKNFLMEKKIVFQQFLIE